MSGKSCSNCKYEDLKYTKAHVTHVPALKLVVTGHPNKRRRTNPCKKKLTLEQAVEKFKGRTLKPGAMEQIEGLLEPVSRVWEAEGRRNGLWKLIQTVPHRLSTIAAAARMFPRMKWVLFFKHTQKWSFLLKNSKSPPNSNATDEHNDAAIDWKNLHQEKVFYLLHLL